MGEVQLRFGGSKSCTTVQGSKGWHTKVEKGEGHSSYLRHLHFHVAFAFWIERVSGTAAGGLTLVIGLPRLGVKEWEGRSECWGLPEKEQRVDHLEAGGMKGSAFVYLESVPLGHPDNLVDEMNVW